MNKCGCVGGTLGHRLCHEARTHQGPCLLETPPLPAVLAKPRALCSTIGGNSKDQRPHRHPTGTALSAQGVRARVFLCTRGRTCRPQPSSGHRSFLKPVTQEVLSYNPQVTIWLGDFPCGRGLLALLKLHSLDVFSDDSLPGTLSASQGAPSCPPSLFNQVSIAFMGKGRR